MKLAIVADIHGNLVALDAVQEALDRERPDLVVCGGDVVLNGPRPAECLRHVQERGWPTICGNADAALWEPARVPAALVERREWALERLDGGALPWLRALPWEWRQGDDVALVHAVPGDLWTVVAADAPDAELQRTYGPLGATLAVYCHIHVPFVRHLPSGQIVADTGSVGRPLDGDPRASYLLVVDGEPETRRVPYDTERAVHDLEATGFPAAGELAASYREGR